MNLFRDYLWCRYCDEPFVVTWVEVGQHTTLHLPFNLNFSPFSLLPSRARALFHTIFERFIASLEIYQRHAQRHWLIRNYSVAQFKGNDIECIVQCICATIKFSFLLLFIVVTRSRWAKWRVTSTQPDCVPFNINFI